MNTKPLTTKILTLSLLLAFIFSSCKNSGNSQSVVVKETRDQYQLAIDYNKSNTDAVEQYLTRFIGQDTIFKAAHPSEINVTMADKTTFAIKSTPGDFSLSFDKSKNSKTALNRVKKINEELKTILK